MILMKAPPSVSGVRPRPIHQFEREDTSERWVTACGRRFDIARIWSGPATELECRKCLSL